MKISIGMINVPTKMGTRGYEECYERTSARCDIFGMNEVFARFAKRTVIQESRQHGNAQWGTGRGPNPLFWDETKYRKRWASQHLLHGRGPRYAQYPGFNERRKATVVVLEDLMDTSNPDTTVINTHLLALASRKIGMVWGRRARKRSLRLIRDIVREHLEAGRIVILMGDMNMRLPFWVNRRFTWVRGRGIDKIGIAVPKGYRVVKKEFSLFAAPTDHQHGVEADIWIEKAS